MKKQDSKPGSKKMPAGSGGQKPSGKLNGPGLLKVEELDQVSGGGKNANNGGALIKTGS